MTTAQRQEIGIFEYGVQHMDDYIGKNYDILRVERVGNSGTFLMHSCVITIIVLMYSSLKKMGMDVDYFKSYS